MFVNKSFLNFIHVYFLPEIYIITTGSFFICETAIIERGFSNLYRAYNTQVFQLLNLLTVMLTHFEKPNLRHLNLSWWES